MSDTKPTGHTTSTLTVPASRRAFLRKSAVAAVGAGVLAACATKGEDSAQGAKSADSGKSAANAARPGASTADSDQSGGSTAPNPTLPDVRAQADAMDAMHEKGVKAFPAKTEGKGNQLLQPRMEGRVKVFEITAREIDWEVEPGKRIKAWAYNDQVPGP